MLLVSSHSMFGGWVSEGYPTPETLRLGATPGQSITRAGPDICPIRPSGCPREQVAEPLLGDSATALLNLACPHKAGLRGLVEAASSPRDTPAGDRARTAILGPLIPEAFEQPQQVEPWYRSSHPHPTSLKLRLGPSSSAFPENKTGPA